MQKVLIHYVNCFQVLLLAMAGSIKDAISVLTTALLSDSLVFVKKPDFCQEVVRLIYYY